MNVGKNYILKSVPYMPENILPKRWRRLGSDNSYYDTKTDTGVTLTLDTMGNGKTYLHLQVYKNNRRPDWDEVQTVKNAFIGKDRAAYIFLPVAKLAINESPYEISLWSEWKDENA